MRVVIVDLLCNSPFYCAELVGALRATSVEAELASPRFYLEPEFLDETPRPRWIRDLVVHASQPRALRLAVRAIEGSLNFVGLIAAIRRGRYDVVHVQWLPIEGRWSPFMPLLRWACDSSGSVLVYTAHNPQPHDSNVSDRAAIRRTLDEAHLVVAHTEHVARQLEGAVGTRSPVTVIPHGPLFIDQALPARAEAAARLGVPSVPTVLFLGLLRPYKGLDLLADAWPVVRQRHPLASLLVVGKVGDEAVRPELDRLRALGGVRVVESFVPVPNMLDFYAVADVVVFPYRSISQSGALMTAAGLGRPTVVTPIPGFREQTAVLASAVTADDVTGPALAGAIASSLERRESLGLAAARDRDAIAESPVGWQTVARRTLEAYEALRGRLVHGDAR